MKGVLIGIGVILLGMGAVIVKFVTAPTPQVAPPAVEPSAPAAAAGAPASAAAADPVKAAVPPPTPPPAADEKLPPREEAVAAAPQGNKPDKGVRSGGRGSGVGKKGASGVKTEAAAAPAEKPVVAAAPAKPVEPARPKATDSIDDLLAAAGGGKKAAPKEEAPARRPAAETPAAEAKALDKTDIVRGMTPVNNKARECFAQFKVPGMVNLKITVAPSGKVTSVAAGGKFAGTPSGDCVETAAKTAAKFPASAGMTFDYPVMLR
jgi:hypothetical protein